MEPTFQITPKNLVNSHCCSVFWIKQYKKNQVLSLQKYAHRGLFLSNQLEKLPKKFFFTWEISAQNWNSSYNDLCLKDIAGLEELIPEESLNLESIYSLIDESYLEN